VRAVLEVSLVEGVILGRQKLHFENIYTLCFLSYTAKHTIEFAGHLLEWMGPMLQKHFDDSRKAPFSFKYGSSWFCGR